MKKKRTLFQILAAGVVSLALSSAAFASNAGFFEGASAIPSVGLPDQAAAAASSSAGDHLAAAAAHAGSSLSATAAAVLAAITGGASPSTVNASQAKHDDEDDEISESNDETPAGTTGTGGTRGGFGCGDKNHEHTGPAGRPNATLPPGCRRKRAEAAAASRKS